jgi:hypothetical protein
MGYRDTATTPNQMTDEQAIERYRYMLASAPPEDIERAHEEAFARLTPDQRRTVLNRLSEFVPPAEIRGDDPASLARTATRAELREPGTMDRAFGGGWSGPGLGSFFLSSLAGAFIGSAIAQSFFGDPGADAGGVQDSGQTGDSADTADAGDSGDFGDGGDFGGGDFGDFGGGDLGF